MITDKSLNLTLEEWIKLSDSGTKVPVITKLNGDSMAPLIRSKTDTVTIIPVKNELKVGQIVIFRIAKNTCIAHRIYKIDGDIITTFGDNCKNPDAPIRTDMIVGILSHLQRGKLKINLNCKTQLFYGKIWMTILRHFWNLYKSIYHKLKK